MNIPSTDEIDADLEAAFDAVVTLDFRKKLENMAIKAAEEYGYELSSQLSYMLEDGQLSGSIRDAAQRMASDFISAIQRGDDNAVEQFFGTPNNPYYNDRERIRAGEELVYSGVALRRKLIEAVQDRLENEHIKDMQAELKILRESYARLSVGADTLERVEVLRLAPSVDIAIRDLLKTVDDETATITVGQDAGCPVCTANTVPYEKTTGVCAYHRLIQLLEHDA